MHGQAESRFVPVIGRLLIGDLMDANGLPRWEMCAAGVNGVHPSGRGQHVPTILLRPTFHAPWDRVKMQDAALALERGGREPDKGVDCFRLAPTSDFQEFPEAVRKVLYGFSFEGLGGRMISAGRCADDRVIPHLRTRWDAFAAMVRGEVEAIESSQIHGLLLQRMQLTPWAFLVPQMVDLCRRWLGLASVFDAEEVALVALTRLQWETGHQSGRAADHSRGLMEIDEDTSFLFVLRQMQKAGLIADAAGFFRAVACGDGKNKHKPSKWRNCYARVGMRATRLAEAIERHHLHAMLIPFDDEMFRDDLPPPPLGTRDLGPWKDVQDRFLRSWVQGPAFARRLFIITGGNLARLRRVVDASAPGVAL